MNIRLVDDQGKQFNLLAAETAQPHRRHHDRRRPPLPAIFHRHTNCWRRWTPTGDQPGANINPTFSESDWGGDDQRTTSGGSRVLSGMEVLSYKHRFMSRAEMRALTWDTLFKRNLSWAKTAYIIHGHDEHRHADDGP